MQSKQICEYLTDIGLIPFENIDDFFEIYSKNSKINKPEKDVLKDSLFLYFQKISNNEKLLQLMSSQIIETYQNTKIIHKYKSLKNLINIFNSKFFLLFNKFIYKLSTYIIKKNKENKEISSDESSESEENKEMKKEKNKKIVKSKNKNKNKQNKNMNKYKNNWYKDINDNNDLVQYGFFIGNNTSNNINTINNINNPYNTFNNDSETPPYYQNRYANSAKINYYMPKYIINDNNNIYNNINYNYNYNDAGNKYDFFENQELYLKKAKNKMIDLIYQKEAKQIQECTFSPKIYSKVNMNDKNRNNVFDKLYNDYNIKKKEKEEKIKQNLEKYSFTPNFDKNKKNKKNKINKEIHLINIKENIKKEKKKENNNNLNEEPKIKKKPIIDWDKVQKKYNEQYKHENNFYNRNINPITKINEEEQKKEDKEDNKINEEEQKIEEKEDNNKINEDIKSDDIDNNMKDINSNETDTKKSGITEDKENITDDNNNGFKSSLKKILNNNSLLKKDY